MKYAQLATSRALSQQIRLGDTTNFSSGDCECRMKSGGKRAAVQTLRKVTQINNQQINFAPPPLIHQATLPLPVILSSSVKSSLNFWTSSRVKSFDSFSTKRVSVVCNGRRKFSANIKQLNSIGLLSDVPT